MSVKRVLIASRNPELVSRLDDCLSETCTVALAFSNGEALSMLRYQYCFEALLIDQALLDPNVVEIALHLQPGLYVIPVAPEDIPRISAVVDCLPANQKRNDTASAPNVS